MENSNANPTNPQSSDLSPDLKNLFSDYHKKQDQATTKKSKEDLLKRYFVPRNPFETFRILPPAKGRKRIEEAFFHVVTTNLPGGKKKHGTVIYCPAHNDPKVPKLDPNGHPILDGNGSPIMVPAPCPLCEKSKKLLADQDNSIKGKKRDELPSHQQQIFDSNKKIFMDSNSWAAKKFYIVKGIDRGRTSDGVKFFRFKHNYKNQGTLDKLLPVLELYLREHKQDYADVKFGTDLEIIMTNTEWNGRVYKTISSIIYKAPSPLHADSLVAQNWLSDDTTWRDVFLPKKAANTTPYEYLQLVVEGNAPYWDDTDANNKHWVFPKHPELEIRANTRNQNLDADSNDNYEQASDLDVEYSDISVETMTPSKVGAYIDNASDLGAEVLAESKVKEKVSEPVQSKQDSYEDLPF